MLLKRLTIMNYLKKLTIDTSNLVKKTDYNTNINEIKNNLNDYDHAKIYYKSRI